MATYGSLKYHNKHYSWRDITPVSDVEIEMKFGDFTTKYAPELPDIDDVKYDLTKGTTTIFWSDMSETTVKCAPDDKFDLEIGVVYAIVKKVYTMKGSKDFNGIIRDAVNKGEINWINSMKARANDIFDNMLKECGAR